jgi:hypothetical protein
MPLFAVRPGLARLHRDLQRHGEGCGRAKPLASRFNNSFAIHWSPNDPAQHRDLWVIGP